MALNWPAKSPDERLDYTINWAQAIGTDVISASTWTISDSGLTTDDDSFSPTVTTIWLLGGTPNTTYTVTNTMTTAGGRIYVQAVYIKAVTPTQ